MTLDQLFAQVPAGGNDEPAVRQLQAGPADHGITTAAADRIAVDRQQLSSFGAGRRRGHPADADRRSATLLLTTEAQRPQRRRRAPAALNAYDKAFAGTTGPDHAGHRAHRDLHRRSGRPSPSPCCRPRPTR